ncbi:MAG: ATP-binding cassette domain-containing protein [Synergistaceae bacterium]|nr:ATP-binding cassette domain-containing protein [Synergistaceae bacterium]
MSYVLPDGRTLFEGLSESFFSDASALTALVGRNGAGKTVLAKIMAGLLTPSSGEVKRSGKVFYLPQTTDALPSMNKSGGEHTRALLTQAFFSDAEFLILDEPTNHLDAPSRRSLVSYMLARNRDRAKGMLVITHDRSVLAHADRIVELSGSGLKSYGGNYEVYRECKERELAAGQARLERAKTDRKRAAAELRASVERQEHRMAQGARRSAKLGAPRALLHLMRQSAERTMGKRRGNMDEKTSELAEAEKEAFFSLAQADPVVMIPPACSVHAAKIVATIDGIILPFGSHKEAIDLTMTGPERVAVEGANGSGKTTLPRGEAGTRLAQIGVRLLCPTDALSGGERLKTALLCALHRSPPPMLLILDEPTNHLDLESVESVEKVLNAYTGALLVVSHDAAFLERIGVGRRVSL